MRSVWRAKLNSTGLNSVDWHASMNCAAATSQSSIARFPARTWTSRYSASRLIPCAGPVSLSGHFDRIRECPLLGLKRTSRFDVGHVRLCVKRAKTLRHLRVALQERNPGRPRRCFSAMKSRHPLSLYLATNYDRRATIGLPLS
jgi:hypothetical protein